MSLMRMGSETSDSVRFMDDIDLNLSLDSRGDTSQQSTSLEISVKPVVFRASYRDIDLITNIVNRALELYSQSIQASQESNTALERPTSGSSKRPALSSYRRGNSRFSGSRSRPVGHAQVVVSREQVSSDATAYRGGQLTHNAALVQGLLRWSPSRSYWRLARTTLVTLEGQAVHSWSEGLVRRGEH